MTNIYWAFKDTKHSADYVALSLNLPATPWSRDIITLFTLQMKILSHQNPSHRVNWAEVPRYKPKESDSITCRQVLPAPTLACVTRQATQPLWICFFIFTLGLGLPVLVALGRSTVVSQRERIKNAFWKAGHVLQIQLLSPRAIVQVPGCLVIEMIGVG